MSGRLVPPGCALAGTGKTLAGRWIQASATWGRAPPGLRERVGGQLGAAIRGRGGSLAELLQSGRIIGNYDPSKE